MTDPYVPIDREKAQWTLNADDSQCARNESNLADAYVEEQIEIAGAVVNLFKLLGVHEQGRLQDLIGEGNAIASSTAVGYVLTDGFTDDDLSWMSGEVGAAVLTSFIGYNFGTKKSYYGTEAYAPSAPVVQHITTIKIQQSATAANRVRQVRVERSNDGGLTWSRVDVVNLPNDGNLNEIAVRASAPAQMWRIVPTMFTGGVSDGWEVVRLQMFDYEVTRLDNVQDRILNENRDRAYAETSMKLKAHYDLIDVTTDFARFGIELPTQYIFTVSFNSMVSKLGRPVVIGDILEIPSELQYDSNLQPVKKYLEVTDTGWSASGFTPNWRPVVYKFHAQPLIASSQTRDVVGRNTDALIADDDFLANIGATNVAHDNVSEEIGRVALDVVPEIGSNVTDLPMPTDAQPDIPRAYDPRGTYTSDGIPPNGETYTEDNTFPTTPADGDYHRLTYPASTGIPTKLYRYNGALGRWKYMETDMRYKTRSHKPTMHRMLTDSTRKAIDGDDE